MVPRRGQGKKAELHYEELNKNRSLLHDPEVNSLNIHTIQFLKFHTKDVTSRLPIGNLDVVLTYASHKIMPGNFLDADKLNHLKES